MLGATSKDAGRSQTDNSAKQKQFKNLSPPTTPKKSDLDALSHLYHFPLISLKLTSKHSVVLNWHQFARKASRGCGPHCPSPKKTMSRPYRRDLSTERLAQQLPALPPPLPLDQIEPQSSKEIQLPPYRDVEEEAVGPVPECQPPGYEPMYDYLRTHQPPINPLPPQYDASTSIQIPSQQSTRTIVLQPPYRDEPFVITIDAPPPSYNEVYREHEEHLQLQRLIREFDENGSPAESSEEIFKWFLSMMMIILTVAAVGTAFDWGRCTRPGHC